MFTELTIHINLISSVSGDTTSEYRARGWNSVDGVLSQLNLCKDATLVLTPQQWLRPDRFKVLTERYFPLMWKNRRVVLEEQPPAAEDVILKEIRWDML